VLRAARLLREASGTRQGAAISLVKRIPVAAGRGGGSADAAAALLALTRFWGLSIGGERLLTLAASIGSDVPFFLNGPTAFVEGRGEVVRPLPAPRPVWVVLAVPRLDLLEKTRHLYAALKPEDYSDGTRARQLAALLEAGEPVDPALLVNAFERVALGEFPAIRVCRDALLAAGAPWARLSGSGPALYTFVEEEGEALALRRRVAASVDRADTGLLVASTLSK
jgi:4-diphosphocytidyl-2-C-methyl-D-erythritol kinase